MFNPIDASFTRIIGDLWNEPLPNVSIGDDLTVATNGRVYWSTFDYDSICSCNLDGTDLQVEALLADEGGYAQGLEQIDDYLYVAQYDADRIVRFPLGDPGPWVGFIGVG